MRRRLWIGWLLAAVWCITVAASAYGKDMENPDASDGVRIYDMADLFSDDEEEGFKEEIDNYQKEWKLDLVVVTTEDAKGKGSTEYADDFYDAGGFGQGSKKDGILFLIDMDNRELTFSTSGKAIRIFTDDRIESMLDGVYEGASEGDYAGCVRTFLSDAEQYCEAGIPDGQYNYDTETGEISEYKRISWGEALFALVVSAVVAGGACLGVKRQYGMEEDERQIRNMNMAYRTESRFAYNDKRDELVNKFVTSRVIPRNTESSSSSSSRSGGSHSSAGRSSTHHSSSGRSHGGGSRKF